MLEEEMEQLGLQGFSCEEEGEVVEELAKIAFSQVAKGEENPNIGKDERYLSPKLPDEVRKNQSLLADTMLLQEIGETGVSFEKEETDRSLLPVQTRISLSYENMDTIVSLSNKNLTNFDREVMDAVATLAPYMETVSASTIYRTITGKSNQSVNSNQIAKVEESMEKCRACVVKIKKNHDSKKIKGPVMFDGNLISFDRVTAQVPRGQITCYRILSIPPLFLFAESVGRVSHFPLKLLDTPVYKTDVIISLQSQLLRMIDGMQKGANESREIFWTEVYKMAGREDSPRQYQEKTRKIVKEILDYWVKENFIQGYAVSGKGKTGKIHIELIDS